jgi:hypothetical protein
MSEPRAEAPQSWPGRTLAGRYLIQEKVGSGVLFGRVGIPYKALDTTLKRVVTLEMLEPRIIDTPDFIRRLEKVLPVLARLRHPGIVLLYDWRHDADGYYFVSEFIESESLEARQQHLEGTDRQMPVAEAVSMIATIGDAISYVHQRSLVHTNLKPSSILIDDRGAVYLTEYGFAWLARDLEDMDSVVGPPGYMSPEQVMGRGFDARSDIYSLGAILFEMLAGRPMYEADTAMAQMMKHVLEPVPDLSRIRPDVPHGLAIALQKALVKDPNDRFQTAMDFTYALRRAQPEDMAAEAIVQTPTHSPDARPGGRSQAKGDVAQRAAGGAVAARFFVKDKEADTLRLDVAAPEKVEVGRAFVLACLVRRKKSPRLSEDDLPRVRSGALRVIWPWFRRSVRLRLQLNAPDCEIHGSTTHSFRLARGKDSPVLRFHLTPRKPGRISIIVTVFQKQEGLGSAHVQTTAYEETVGRVAMEVTSYPLEGDELGKLVTLRRDLDRYFSLSELRELCFDLNIDYEKLPATKGELIIGLISHCLRHGQLGELIALCRQQRPAGDWELSEATK